MANGIDKAKDCLVQASGYLAQACTQRNDLLQKELQVSKLLVDLRNRETALHEMRTLMGRARDLEEEALQHLKTEGFDL